MLNVELADESQTEAEFHMQNISKDRKREVVTICIKTLIKRIIAKLSNTYCSVKTLSVKVIAMVEKVFPDLKQGIASSYLKVNCEVAGTLGKRATRSSLTFITEQTPPSENWLLEEGALLLGPGSSGEEVAVCH